jgi:hypothetical protein
MVFDKTIQYSGSDKVALQQGVVYVRRQSATTPASQHELNEAMDRLVARNLRAFIARIDHIASLPASAQLIATSADTDQGYVLTARGEGIPVTIVGPEEGANAVKIDETLLPDVPLAGPTHELANQVRQWRMDPGHRVKPSTLHRWYLQREYLDLSVVQDGAEFALISALDGSDFPMFWASQVERPKLKALVEEKGRNRRLSGQPHRAVCDWRLLLGRANEFFETGICIRGCDQANKRVSGPDHLRPRYSPHQCTY